MNQEKPIQLSASAAKRVLALIAAQKDKKDKVLRLAVAGGGCAGFQYEFSLEEFSLEADKNKDDLVIEKEGAMMVIDPLSVNLLKGAEVDFVEEPIGSYFKVNNPNAISGCGCGSSFSVG